MFRGLLSHEKVKDITEWTYALGIALAVYVLLQLFVFKALTVTGVSMEPTFEHGDRAIVSVFSYYVKKPQYNDIIAFSYKEEPSKTFIKRIIGLPGDVIDLGDYGFTVNGELLDDEFSKDIVSALPDVELPLTVPEDSYFVLGDNRNASKDSRYVSVGCIPKKDIVGKVIFKIWPLTDIGKVK